MNDRSPPPRLLDHVADIPNLVTFGNLVSGATGAMFIVIGDLRLAGVALVLSVCLDFLDGRLARGAFADAPAHRRAFGRELDTLADLVAFSLLPGLIVLSAGGGTLAAGLVGLLFPLCGAARLAYFNLHGMADGRFVGIPTTYAGFLLGTALALQQYFGAPWWPIATVAVVLCAAQVLPIPVPKRDIPIPGLVVAALIVSVILLASGGGA